MEVPAATTITMEEAAVDQATDHPLPVITATAATIPIRTTVETVISSTGPILVEGAAGKVMGIRIHIHIHMDMGIHIIITPIITTIITTIMARTMAMGITITTITITTTTATVIITTTTITKIIITTVMAMAMAIIITTTITIAIGQILADTARAVEEEEEGVILSIPTAIKTFIHRPMVAMGMVTDMGMDMDLITIIIVWAIIQMGML